MREMNRLRIVNLSICPAGHAAARRLAEMSAMVIEVGPPGESPRERERLERLLAKADLFITDPSSALLEHPQLGWATLRDSNHLLCQVAIIFLTVPSGNLDGQVVTDRTLPVPSALEDAERVVNAARGLLQQRAGGKGGGYAEVAILPSGQRDERERQGGRNVSGTDRGAEADPGDRPGLCRRRAGAAGGAA